MHGSLTPWWQDGLLHGHTVVWVPGARCLVDSTVSQYVHVDGSVIALAEDDADEGEIIVVDTGHAGQHLRYALAPRVASAAVLAHPTIGNTDIPYQRFGTNIAAAVVSYLTENLPAARAADLHVRRAAALVEAVRGLPTERTIEGNHQFVIHGPDGRRRSLQLDEIGLPDGTPAARRVAPLPGWR